MLASLQDTDVVAAEDAMLGELPKGWAESTLGEVFHWQSGGTPRRTVAQYYGGQVPWAIIGDLNDSVVESTEATLTEEGLRSSTVRWARQGAVLLAMYGSIGKLGIAGMDLTTNQAIAFTQTGIIPNKYLFFFLLAKRNELITLGKGDTQSNISQAVIKHFPFILAPLPEQRRIVAEIEKQFTRLDASVAALKRVQANLKRYRASVLKAACEGKLVPTEAELAEAEGRDYEPAGQLLARILSERRARWQSQEKRGRKYKEPAAPDTSNLPKLPDGWVWCSVAQLASVGTGSTPLTSKSQFYQDGTVPWITSAALNHPNIASPNGFVTEQAVRECRLTFYPTHTLLVAMYGEGRTRGKCSELLVRSTINQAIAAISMEESASDCRQYTKLFLSNNYEETRRLSSGGVQPNLNLGLVRQIAIPLPPLAEQFRIVADVDRRLSVIQQAEAAVEANLARADRLRQSILKQAFSGRLVPQDPNDEPASVLLERIRAEREAAQAAAKSKRKPRRRRAIPRTEPVLQERAS